VIKLLVVDDSPLMRRLLGDLFAAEGDFEVSFARNGAEALEMLSSVQPDVITLDVQMPAMDGLECLDRIMVQRPTPVVMASSLTVQGASEALRALDLGAVDLIAKPSGAVSLKMDSFGPPLVEKVRAAAQVRLRSTHRLRDRVRARVGVTAGPTTPLPARRAGRSRIARAFEAGGESLVVVGCSTGGPPALDALLGPLPASFPWPIVVAQHMPETFTAALARRLDKLAALNVVEVRQLTKLAAGFVYVARGDADMIVTRRGGELFALSAPADSERRWHPSVDRLVDSAMAQLPATSIIGVLMTGMGNDGANSMARLFRDGGQTLAESESSAVVWGMPGELVRAEGASLVVDLEDLAAALTKAVAA
jgi:two-component system chemotaxis response regulator CheB